ncbi:hypothetical protein JCM19235_277 [Vibrio maritimus]|uniref:Uncharacterized protein n=1 Tax=Vibrio maritimus TaxID=990268 RepID=A0A090SNR4_9VIBR|nr:hypothetical protein JCM19235_277 [Vibrio maritimus]
MSEQTELIVTIVNSISKNLVNMRLFTLFSRVPRYAESVLMIGWHYGHIDFIWFDCS